MLKIKRKGSNKVEEVTRNVAFGLVERGEAEYVNPDEPQERNPRGYNTRKLSASQTK